MALAAARAARLAAAHLDGEDDVLALLRTVPPTTAVSVRVTASARRGLHGAADLLRAEAGAHACHLALAETGHVAAHWIDAIVWGTAADLDAFLTDIAPALVRTGGRRAHHGVDAIVAA
jgi:hypothetical protein